MNLSVVIVSYNTRDLLDACLASVTSTMGSASNYEVIVVDNASLDGSAAMVKETFRQANLIVNQENRGFAAANNQAIERSSGRHVILLNPDTVVREGALNAMVKFLEDNPEVGVVGPKLVFPDGSFQHSAFSFPTLLMIFIDFFPLNHRVLNSRLNGRYPRSLYDAGDPFPIDHPLGAGLMVRREVLEEVGLLDERFFMYCEEIDWCMRIKRAGWEIFCLPEAEIVHHVGQSTKQFHSDMFVELHKSRCRLYAKHYSRSFQRMAHLLVALGVAYRSMRDRWAFWRGSVEQDALNERLDAYHRIRSLS
ncbi:MAG: glycosyltransferase [Anaerolineae bacterium]|nr:glycosyltransferase [Anaerolineae bacterium]NIO00406.1 glycosyltransferase [Anaerolineae bacterium]NIQ83176.1 glycosyltransferase [Anaerolineae bacterium]